MRYREIDQERAKQIAVILKEECGFQRALDESEYFTHAILAPYPGKDYVCHEYRFMGSLGFGGKFRNNGNNKNVPYVDCYPEDETPERREMIKAANDRLAKLFSS